MKEESKTENPVPSLNTEKLKYFEAGDIVTAESLNALVDAIELLEKRVMELEKNKN